MIFMTPGPRQRRRLELRHPLLDSGKVQQQRFGRNKKPDAKLNRCDLFDDVEVVENVEQLDIPFEASSTE